MSKGDTFENDLLKLLFQNTAITGIADAAASPVQLFFALHTADPGETGNQTTNEVAYTGYARPGLTRSSGNFTVSTNTVTLAAQLNFPQCTAAASVTVTHFSIGTSVSGAGKILYSGTVSPNFGIALNVTPFLGAGTSVTED